jgi:S1-C subfamily serine protease
MLREVCQSSVFLAQAKMAMVLTAVLIGANANRLYAQRSEPPNRTVAYTADVREQIKKIIPAIGLILVRSANEPNQKLRPRGSAVIVRKDGLVVTNFHVIAQDRSTRLFDELFLSLPSEPGADATTASRQFRLKPVLTNQERDLALLRALPAQADDPPLALPFVEIGDSRSVELLDDIFIIGFPEKGGTTVTVNPGVVEGRDALDDWIKTNGRLLHGNSGGAAVNGAGKLVGIPTRVVVDSDAQKTYGSVGYLRPAHLVAALISKYQEAEMNAAAQKSTPAATPNTATPTETKAAGLITVRGVVKSTTGMPLAGVRVGLLLVGKEVAASNLITWGGSNAEGEFIMEKNVAPGRYNLRARVVGYDTYSLDLDLTSASMPLTIELKPTAKD